MLFQHEPHFELIQLIAGIHVRTRRFTEKRIRALNMTYPQLGALMALARRDGVTQRELAELLETDTSTAMVLCDSLQKRGWLERRPDKADRRVNRLVLTETGRKAHIDAVSLIQAGYEYVFGRMSSDEVARVLPFLRELYRNVTEVSSGERKREVK